MRTLLWALFIILVAYMTHQATVVNRSTSAHYQLIQAESADSTLGRTMFRAWAKVPYGRGTMLDVLESNTDTDFLFITTYTLLLMLCSYMQMQNESYLPLNTLLRFNLLLALIISGLDVTENLKILYNIRHLHDAGLYCSPYIVSTLKWLLSAWAVLLWLISVVKSAFQSSKHSKGS